MKLFAAIGVYGLIAFVIGFALMAYELVASRILAPRIGSSIYVWTSIIGVIIAALSLGYAAGGILADRRNRPLDVAIMLLAASATVLTTLLAAPIALGFVGDRLSDPRLQGVVAATWLFVPTSFVIGMISPYLARLKISSINTTGTTVASLSALNAIGGILGTFFTGFIFFAYIGSTQSLLLISLMLLAASWTIQPRKTVLKRLAATAAILLVGLLSLLAAGLKPPDVVAVIDTPESHYKIIKGNLEGRPILALTAGPGGMQSGIYLDGSDELAFRYTSKIADLIAKAPRKDSILMLGGGTFTLPQYLSLAYPSSHIDVVEIDAQLLPIARQYFEYQDPKNVRIITSDARTYLNRNQQSYDIVIIDVYSDTLIPPTLATREYARELRRAVKPDGIVLANVIGSDNPGCRGLLRSLHASYKSEFTHSSIYPLGPDGLDEEGNIIIAYSSRESPWLPPVPHRIPAARPFTDNFSPVEHRKQRCQSYGSQSEA